MNNNHFDSFRYGERANDRNMQDRVRYDNGTNCRGANDIDMMHCHHGYRQGYHRATGNDNTLWIVLIAALLIICNCCN